MAFPVVYCSGRVTLGMPFGMGSAVRKLGIAKLIWCRRGSFALIKHFDAWKLLEMGV